MDNAIALPLHSLYGNRRIYLVDEDRLVGHEVVTLGHRLSADGELQVLVSAESLNAEDSILSTNLPKATTGLRVQVINSSLTAPSGDQLAEAML